MSSIAFRPHSDWDVPTSDPGHVLEDDEDSSDSGSGEYVKEINPNQHYGKQMIDSMKAVRFLFHSIGRFPISCEPIEEGMFLFRYNWSSPHMISFMFTSCIIFFMLFIVLFNVFLIAFGFRLPINDGPDWGLVRLREQVVAKRYLVMLIIFGTSLFQSAFSTVVIIHRREYFANYFGFWTRSIQTIQMDVSRGITRFTLVLAGVFGGFSVLILILFAVRITSSLAGLPIGVAMLVFRLFVPNMLVPVDQVNFDFSVDLRVLEWVGMVLFIMNFFWSKSFLILYMIKAKMLTNAFAYWNGRVYAAVLRDDFTQTRKGRTTYLLLFKDHCVLLDLLDGTNMLFSGILETYFGFQVASIIFELYFFYRVATHGNELSITWDTDHNEDADFYLRRNDFLVAPIFFIQSLCYLFFVANTSFDMCDEAAAGLEVIRRKSLIGRTTDEELFFVLSLYSSFSSYDAIELSGGGFFGVNKDFWMGVVGVTCSLVVILIHIAPVFDHTDKLNRKQIGVFLVKLEGLRNCHWIGHGWPANISRTNCPWS